MTSTKTSKLRDIPAEEWSVFLGAISRHYAGRTVEIRLMDPELGVFLVASGLAFIGITFDSAAGEAPTIRVAAGDLNSGHIAHDIVHPKRVRMRQEMNGVDNAIEIESSDSPTVLIEFAAESAKRI